MPRTVTLFELNNPQQFGPPTTVPIVDLYSGVGGYSTGATAAGHTVCIAVDAWTEAVRWHMANHPSTQHHLYWLPDDRLINKLPPRRTRHHIHGSPPCQKFSNACHLEKDQHARRLQGMEQVQYFLELVRDREPVSFTMEQVDNEMVRALLDDYMERYPEWMDYEVVHMEQYGVPQARKRLIAGSPWIIQRLRNKRQVFGTLRARDGCKTIPREATGIKGQRVQKNRKDMSRPSATNPVFKKNSLNIDMNRRAQKGGLSVPAPTVMAGNTLRWTKGGGYTIRNLTPREHADYQTFPDDYQFPSDNSGDAQCLCGNSVPPHFAKTLMSNYRLPLDRHTWPEAIFPARPLSPSL